MSKPHILTPGLISLLCWLLIGCSSNGVGFIGCPEEVDHAVMIRLLHGEHVDIDNLAVQYAPRRCAEIPTILQRLDAIDDWAAQQSDRCVRAAYRGWIWYFRRGAHEAETECTTHSEAIHFRQYQEDQAKERTRNAEYEATHDFPAPPK